jgi:hypothetical protein
MRSVDVFVSFPDLERVETEMRRLVVELSALDELATIQAGAEDMGRAEVTEAVDWFGVRWQNGRRAIADQLTGCLAHVGDALAAYQATEQDLTCAAGPTNLLIRRSGTEHDGGVP